MADNDDECADELTPKHELERTRETNKTLQVLLWVLLSRQGFQASVTMEELGKFANERYLVEWRPELDGSGTLTARVKQDG